LVSACLLGVNCRYDGGSNGPRPELMALMQKHTLIPVCPEILGGLPTPRQPAERRGEMVATRDYRNVTENYERGADEVLQLARLYRCEYAILKEKSPACGHGMIYDGTFTKTLIKGHGVAAALLEAYGITVLGESEIAGFHFPD